MVASWFTEWIGIYSVFGAFLLGTAIPRGKLGDEVHRLVHPLTTTLLLPLFFVYSGLNTRIALVDTPALWGLTLAVLLAAIAGKGFACFAAARIHGAPPREAAAIGALMNARGLVELVLLNIGYERGIIGGTLFAILVTMAIVTTLMATPVFDRVYGRGVSDPGRAAP
jgi:Kef-type K+ transport system membrane component KefB